MNLKWIWKEFEMNLKWILNPFQTHSKFISSPFQINHQWISSEFDENEFDENEFATWKATHSIIDREDGRRWRWAIRNRSSSPSSATWPSGSGTTPAHKSIISIRHQSNYISTSQRQSSLNSMDEATQWMKPPLGHWKCVEIICETGCKNQSVTSLHCTTSHSESQSERTFPDGENEAVAPLSPHPPPALPRCPEMMMNGIEHWNSSEIRQKGKIKTKYNWSGRRERQRDRETERDRGGGEGATGASRRFVGPPIWILMEAWLRWRQFGRRKKAEERRRRRRRRRRGMESPSEPINSQTRQ